MLRCSQSLPLLSISLYNLNRNENWKSLMPLHAFHNTSMDPPSNGPPTGEMTATNTTRYVFKDQKQLQFCENVFLL